MKNKTLEELWETAPLADTRFDPEQVAHLPVDVQRYLRHAIAPGALLSTCVRLRMRGDIQLDGSWHSFEADQVLRWDRGFVWAARAWLNGLPVSGFDELVDGEGAMRWRLLGLFPVMRANGQQVARAAAGRMHAESVWMPAVLLGHDVRWSQTDADHPHASIRAHGETSEVDFSTDADGGLKEVSLPRWGELENHHFAYQPFGGIVEAEGTFEGFTIPTRLRIGWHFGTDSFVTEGEFFRCTITEARFR